MQFKEQRLAAIVELYDCNEQDSQRAANVMAHLLEQIGFEDVALAYHKDTK